MELWFVRVSEGKMEIVSRFFCVLFLMIFCTNGWGGKKEYSWSLNDKDDDMLMMGILVPLLIFFSFFGIKQNNIWNK
jgi:hypothetical protein